MRAVHRTLATTAAVVVVAVLGACSGEESSTDGDSTPDPTASEPSPSTKGDDAVEPELPRAMVTENKAGAKAFVRYYWDLVNYAQATGDVQTLHTLNTSSCAPCDAGVESIANVYLSGGRLDGGVYTLSDLTVRKADRGSGSGTFDVTFTASNTPGTVLDSDGEVTESYDPSTTEIKFQVSWDDTVGWQVTSWSEPS